MKYISLFSGAGGLDLGIREAGFKGLLSVEIAPVCQSTLKVNDEGHKVSEEGDITKLTSRKLMSFAGISKGELDLLVGGPPCQPFSKSGYWANSQNERMADPRADTLREYMRVVQDVLPKVVLIENVSGIAYSSKNDGIKYIFTEFEKINRENNVNYRPVVNLVNAAEYGVPQIRQRVFVVAFRNGHEFKMPQGTHRPDNDLERKHLPVYKSAWDAIGDLDIAKCQPDLEISGKWADLVPSIPEGQNYQWHTDRKGGSPIFGWRTRYWSFLLKLAKNKPSWTITAKPGPATGPLHWKNRYLSIREMARIQTFPDDYKFCGKYREQQVQIGNAVPPAIGELFGLEIRRQLFAGQVRKNLNFLPVKRSDVPKPEMTKKVPSKYRNLMRVHDDHPGIGKGPGALKRFQEV